MIKAVETPIDQSIARVRGWLGSMAMRDLPRVAVAAGVHEKTLRLALEDEWNPTAKTLNKLLAVIPKRTRVA